MFEFVADKLEEINYSSSPSGAQEKNLRRAVVNNTDDFISLFVDVNSSKTFIGKTASLEDIENIEDGQAANIVNFRRVNDAGNITCILKIVNKKLPMGGVFICCAETKEQRYQRIINKYPWYISYPFYYMVDFVIKRLFPKWGPTKKITFFLTKGNNRVLSMPEILGRLVFCGFKINYLKDINNITYFITEKIKEPAAMEKPSYGFFFKMARIGKNGKIINVYKIRTMHPYAEYLQTFMYELNNLKDGGKFNGDFRIAKWGRILRRLWIDELPMIYNWLKGDLKLVGLRPLSFHYLGLYNENLKQRRLKHKPGLIPPFYFDLPHTLDEIMESEEKYLNAYEKNPLLTDFKYFFKCMSNILLKGARSS